MRIAAIVFMILSAVASPIRSPDALYETADYQMRRDCAFWLVGMAIVFAVLSLK